MDPLKMHSKLKNLTMPVDASRAPMRHPCVGYCCHGGIDTDTGSRPFKHASRGRDNWKRAIRKKQRRAWKHVPDI